MHKSWRKPHSQRCHDLTAEAYTTGKGFSGFTFPTSRLGLFVHGNNVSQAIVNKKAQIEVATAMTPLLGLKTERIPLIIVNTSRVGIGPLENVDRDLEGREEGVLVL